MKPMHVDHKMWVEGGTRYEVTRIYSPGDPLKPVHTLERNYLARYMSAEEGTAQSISFGVAIAEKLAKKYRASGVTVATNVAEIDVDE